jgi:hypothetical protein
MGVAIYDATGKKVLDLGTLRTDEMSQTLIKQVNASYLAQGMYLLRMYNQNKQITKPFLKS